MMSAHVPRPPSTLPGDLVVRTVPVAEADPFEFLARHEGGPRFLHWQDESGVAGAGVALQIEATGPDRFAQVERLAAAASRRLHVEPHGDVPTSVVPRWLGGFAFESTGSQVHAPAARFVLASRQLTVVEGQGYLSTIAEVKTAAARRPPPSSAAPIVWRNDPAFETWATSVRGALDAVRSGRVQKLVLSRRLTATLPSAPRLHRVLRTLATRSPSSRVFLDEPEGGFAFLGASPEVLLERSDGRLRTVALAGSRPRGRNDEEDEALARNLLASSKEAWEHELVARFLREELARRGRPFTTTMDRGVRRLPHVQHLETRYESASGPEESFLGLAARLHPTPAVGGAPRAPALDEIARLERRPRGWYAGAIGWFDARGEGELTVGIRSAVVRGSDVTLHAGCGIVEGSDPAEEWAESRAKLQLLADAFEAEVGS